jgi:hypothetical protein
VVADYVISAYFKAADGIYVNLFTPSEVSWKLQETPVKIIQRTTYPESDSTELRVEMAAPIEFTMYVRIPGWLQSPAQITVNGKALSIDARPGSFAAIRRRWQTNDAIQIQFPFALRMEPIDAEHPNTVALMWGPLMLVALDPPLEIDRKSASESAGGLRQAAHSPLTFEMDRAPGALRFMPFYRVQDETYTTYVEVT